MTEKHLGEYLYSTDPALLQPEQIHAYLDTSYWAAGRPLEKVTTSITNSFCCGVYHQTAQVGFARLVTDYATMAYLADVYIHPDHQGHGLGKWMVGSLLAEPEIQPVGKLFLGTLDAHTLYEKFGFHALSQPDRWMEKRNFT